MLHMIVADDMPVQLHMLEEMIRTLRPTWQLHAARDGNEVLALLDEYPVDFVLSDIRMPKLDGLSMLEQVQRRSPKTLVVFLSGFALFEYAQRALRLGAVDYLIKPVDEQILATLLEKLEDLREAQQGVKRHAEASLLNQWLYTPMGQIPPEEAERIAALVGERGLVVAVYRASVPGRYDLSFQNQLRTAFLGDYGVHLLLPHANRELMFLVLEPRATTSDAVAGVKTKLEELSRLTGLRGGLSAFDQRQGCEARRCALEALNEAFYEDTRVASSQQPLQEHGGALPSGTALYGALRHAQAERKVWLGEILQEARQQRRWFPQVLQDAVYTVAGLMEQIRLRDEGTSPEEENLRTFAAKMRMVTGWREFADLYEEMMEALARQIENTAVQSDLPIERCVRYLQTHYAEEISMEDMSRMCFLTPNYFSSLFRKKTGKRFVEYLTDLRLSKAESRIRLSHDFIYEIAKDCGYRDERYFNRVFRSKYGCSPARYRKLHGRVKA